MNFFYVSNFLCVISDERKSKYSFANCRQFDVLCLRLKGESRFLVKGKHYLSRQGSVVFIPKNLEYRQDGQGDEKIIAIHFLASVPPTDNIAVFEPSEDGGIACAFEEILCLYEKSGHAVSAELMSRLYSLFAKLFPSADNPTTAFDRATSIFEAKFCESGFSVLEWASFLGVSRTYLQNLCKEKLRLTPSAYLQARRLGYARELLLGSKYKVKSIGQMCGYYSEKHFISSFSARYGLSPEAYRRKHTPL